MARKWAEMRNLTVPELIDEYDRLATPPVYESLEFVRDEIFQRELAAQTRVMQWLTVVITVLTTVTTLAVLYDVLR